MEDSKKKEGSFMPMYIAMFISLTIAFFWQHFPLIKNTAHAFLNPTIGVVLSWNLELGMILIVFFISLFMTVVQKYATDQETLREMKKEQKRLNDEMKSVRDHPEKLMELQKESMKLIAPMMKLSMRSAVYTIIPLILLFRWFNDHFISAGNPHIFGIFSWFWFYILGSLIFSSILRKALNVV